MRLLGYSTSPGISTREGVDRYICMHMQVAEYLPTTVRCSVYLPSRKNLSGEGGRERMPREASRVAIYHPQVLLSPLYNKHLFVEIRLAILFIMEEGSS